MIDEWLVECPECGRELEKIGLCSTCENNDGGEALWYAENEEEHIRYILQSWIASYQIWITQLNDDFKYYDIQGHQLEIENTEDDLKKKTPEELFESEVGIFEGDLESYRLDMRLNGVIELKQDLIKENIKYLRSKVEWHKNKIEQIIQ